MNWMTPILYGVIIGHWLCNVRNRLFPGKVDGRYAVVAMHSSREEYILIGRCDDRERAIKATDYLEDNSMSYIALCYDLCNPDDRVEFANKKYSSLIEHEDAACIEEAKRYVAHRPK